jgi:hypothetical protein
MCGHLNFLNCGSRTFYKLSHVWQGTAAYQHVGAVLVGGMVACTGDVRLEYKVSIRLDNA